MGSGVFPIEPDVTTDDAYADALQEGEDWLKAQRGTAIGGGSDSRVTLSPCRRQVGQVQAFAAEPTLTVEKIRERLQKMDDEQLSRHGKSDAFLCTPDANHGKLPRETFVIQLAECRAELAEWKRWQASDSQGKMEECQS